MKSLVLASAAVAIFSSAVVADVGARPVHLVWKHHSALAVDPRLDCLRRPSARHRVTRGAYLATALLREYPGLRVTVSLSGSLLHQLDRYYLERLLPFLDRDRQRIDAVGFLARWKGRTDPWIDLALRPSGEPGHDELALLKTGPWNCFSVPAAVIRRFPQYHALALKDPASYSVDDVTAIKCWFLLANFSPVFLDSRFQLASGARIDLRDLVEARSSGTFWLRHRFTEDDASRLVAAVVMVVESFVRVHRTLALDDGRGGGGVELATSPPGDPVLLTLQERDVRRHLDGAVALFRRLFDRRPVGLWLTREGKGAKAAAAIGAAGFRWAVTVSTTRRPPARMGACGGVSDPVLFTGWAAPAPEAGMDPVAAADALVDTIRRDVWAAGGELRTVILEDRAGTGTRHDIRFLRRFYGELGRLRRSGEIVTVTPTAYLGGRDPLSTTR